MSDVSMSSRERMLAAIQRQPVDHLPSSFMMYKALLGRCSSALEFFERQLALGLDVCVQLPVRPPIVHSDTYNLHGLPVTYSPSVKIREWKRMIDGERWPVLFKEYTTPAGTLRAEVYQDDEWPYGDHVPFLDDYLETRSRKFIVTGEADLGALGHLLVPPTETEIEAFRSESAPYLDFARRRSLLVTGGWGVGADLIGWVYGLQNMMFAVYDQPDFLHMLLSQIAAWNQTRMKVVLEAGIDLYIKRAWYENCDFWSPSSWNKFILPILKTDAELAHAYGARFGYLITAHCMPLLDLIKDSGVDVLIGVDPLAWDLSTAKQKLGGKVCLWGGVNGHKTIECGTPDEIRQEVRRAVEILSPGSGFILSPVDNIRQNTPLAQANVRAFIEAWQDFCQIHVS